MFEGFKILTEDEKKPIWENDIFIVDTNVLINIYKYKNVDNYANLLTILKFLKEKQQLYIPYHVALEYYFNKDKNKSIIEDEYSLIFQELKNRIKKTKEEFHEYLQTRDMFKKNLIDNSISSKIEGYFDNIIEMFNEDLLELKENEEDILMREESIENLLETIVGNPFDKEKMELIHTCGEKRYRNSIPPGYKDEKDKKDTRIFGNYEYEEKYGDLIIWEHIKEKSSETDSPIIFITDDVKEDWWYIIRGKKIGIRPELRQELYDINKQNILIYTLVRFIEQALNHYEELNISDTDQKQLIKETKELERINENKYKYSSFNTIKKLKRIEDMLFNEVIAKKNRKYNNIFDVKTEDTPRNIRTVMIKKHYKSPEIAEKVKSLLEYKYEQYISVENSLDNKELFIMCIPLIEQGVNKILEDLII